MARLFNIAVVFLTLCVLSTYAQVCSTDCSDPNANCLSGECRCNEGYYWLLRLNTRTCTPCGIECNHGRCVTYVDRTTGLSSPTCLCQPNYVNSYGEGGIQIFCKVCATGYKETSTVNGTECAPITTCNPLCGDNGQCVSKTYTPDGTNTSTTVYSCACKEGYVNPLAISATSPPCSVCALGWTRNSNNQCQKVTTCDPACASTTEVCATVTASSGDATTTSNTNTNANATATAYTCVCAAGYTRNLDGRCVSNENSCGLGCVNGGCALTLTDGGVNKWVCRCLSGWAGALCDQAVTQTTCDPMCGPNEQCNEVKVSTETTTATAYRCGCRNYWQDQVTSTGSVRHCAYCPPQYTGVDCDQVKTTLSPCDSFTCPQYARCVIIDASFDTTKYGGLILPDVNSGSGVSGGGSVSPSSGAKREQSDTSSRVACMCENRLVEGVCMPQSNPCVDVQCPGGATCVASSYGYRCQCPEGLRLIESQCVKTITGSLCNCTGNKVCVPVQRADGTTENSCKCPPNFQQTATGGCACAAGYTGDGCLTTVNPCGNVDCTAQPGTVCVPVDRFTGQCMCPVNRRGQNCEIDVCADVKCDGGKCWEGKCVCPSLFVYSETQGACLSDPNAVRKCESSGGTNEKGETVVCVANDDSGASRNVEVSTKTATEVKAEATRETHNEQDGTRTTDTFTSTVKVVENTFVIGAQRNVKVETAPSSSASSGDNSTDSSGDSSGDSSATSSSTEIAFSARIISVWQQKEIDGIPGATVRTELVGTEYKPTEFLPVSEVTYTDGDTATSATSYEISTKDGRVAVRCYISGTGFGLDSGAYITPNSMKCMFGLQWPVDQYVTSDTSLCIKVALDIDSATSWAREATSASLSDQVSIKFTKGDNVIGRFTVEETATVGSTEIPVTVTTLPDNVDAANTVYLCYIASNADSIWHDPSLSTDGTVITVAAPSSQQKATTSAAAGAIANGGLMAVAMACFIALMVLFM